MVSQHLFSLQIYQKLRTVEHMHVYNKEDIPDRFFYKKGKFVSPLTLVAEEGWFIVEVKYGSKILIHECEKVQYMKTIRKICSFMLSIELKYYVICLG